MVVWITRPGFPEPPGPVPQPVLDQASSMLDTLFDLDWKHRSNSRDILGQLLGHTVTSASHLA
jgi:hypothetical protein